MWHQDGALGVPGQPREMSALQLWLHSPVLSWTNSCGQRGFSEGRATRTPKRPARLGGILTATWCWQLPGAPSCSVLLLLPLLSSPAHEQKSPAWCIVPPPLTRSFGL